MCTLIFYLFVALEVNWLFGLYGSYSLLQPLNHCPRNTRIVAQMNRPETLRPRQHLANESKSGLSKATALQIQVDKVWVILNELHEALHGLNILFSQWYLSYPLSDLLLG